MEKEKKAKNSIFTKATTVIWITSLIGVAFLFVQNPLRSVSLLLLLSIWQFLRVHLQDPLKASLLWSLLVLPFNITIALPFLANPYVSGVFVNYLVPTISVIDLSVLFILSSLIEKMGDLRTFVRKIPRWLYLLLLYFTLTSVLHYDFNAVISNMRVALYLLTATVLFSNYKKPLSSIKKNILTILLISVAIQMVIGIAQFMMGRSIGLGFLGEPVLMINTISSSFIQLSSGTFLRAYGTFPHPNVLAGYLLFLSIFLMNTVGLERKRALPTLLLSCFLLLLTFSRIHLALFLFFLATTVLYRMYKGGRLFVFPLLIERFSNLFSSADYGLRDRIELFKSSIQLVKQNFLYGLGTNNFVRGLENNIPQTTLGISLLQPVHNIFMLLAVEHGVIQGLLGSIAILARLIGRFWRSHGDLKMLALFIAIATIVVGSFDHYLLTLPQGLFILMIALLY